MKIAYSAVSQVPSKAANSVHVMKMCAALAYNGHEVVLALPRAVSTDDRERASDPFVFYGTERSFTIKRFPWPPISGKAYLFAASVAAWARRYGVDLLYTRSAAIAAASTAFGIPTIYESHTPIADRSTLERWLFARFVKSSSLKRLVVISDALKRWYVEHHPSLADRIIVARDAADLRVRAPAPEGPVKIAGYFGGLYPGRGIDVIIDLAKRRRNIQFRIYGGSAADVSFWSEQSENQDNIIFFGHVAAGEVPAFMAECDVLLAPYQYKVAVHGGHGDISKWISPMKLFEYMASGRPIIVSDLEVLREVVTHEETVLMPPIGDIDAWTSALDRLDDATVRARLADRAYAHLAAEFTWNRRAERVVS